MEDIFDKEKKEDIKEECNNANAEGFSLSFSIKKEGDDFKGKVSFKPSEGLDEKNKEFLEGMFNKIIPQFNKMKFPKISFPRMFDRTPIVFPRIIFGRREIDRKDINQRDIDQREIDQREIDWGDFEVFF